MGDMSNIGLIESGDPDDPLHEALLAFQQCVGIALPDICSYGLTIGDTYVPFKPDEDEDCEEDSEFCSQAWVRVMGVQPKPTPVRGWGGDCAMVLTADLEVGVLRCFEIAEEGEAPDTTQVLIAAMQAMTDMKALLTAALSCEVWDAIDVGQWTPIGPQGGQYGGTWTFTVEFGAGCADDGTDGSV